MSVWRNRWRRWTKLRFVIIYPLGLAAVLFAHCDARSLRSGVGFLAAGLLIRLWANGYAIKTDKLTTSGPYAIVRNPLYLGSTLIIFGFIVVLKLGYLGVAFFCAWLTVYAQTIRREEKALQERFDSDYAAYRNSVPALLPTIFPFKGKEQWGFSFQRVVENKEYKISCWIVIAVIFFYIKGIHGPLSSQHWTMITVAVALGTADIAGEIIKWKRKTLAGN